MPPHRLQLSSLERGGVSYLTTCRTDEIEFRDGTIQGLTLIICPAFDTVQGRQLNLKEKFVLATKFKGGSRNERHEHGLPDEACIEYRIDGHV